MPDDTLLEALGALLEALFTFPVNMPDWVYVRVQDEHAGFATLEPLMEADQAAVLRVKGLYEDAMLAKGEGS